MNLYSTDYPAVYKGIVENNRDPKNLGRCQVRVPSIHGNLTNLRSSLPWAKPITTYSINSKRGQVNIPDIGDRVWVMFEAANREYPLYFGSFYGSNDIPVDINKVDIYVEDGNKITYDRINQSYTFNIGENTISINHEDITIVGNTCIKGDLSVEGTISCNSLIVDGIKWKPQQGDEEE